MFSSFRRAPRLALHRHLSTQTPNNAHKPKVIFSGIQPTGVPHLGNYFGALQHWVHLQNTASAEDTLLFSIVGWHALTLPQSPAALLSARHDMLALLLAVGIDPARSIVFHQDAVQYHTELGWVLNCLTSVGRLQRMTTWKSRLAVARGANDESEVDESLLNAGLLTYPALQAADILLYKTTHVPVGDDQTQHIELTRDIADSFNRTFTRSKPLFPLPNIQLTPARRILSLKDPSAKMSKSARDPKSRIELTHSPEEIAARIRGAVTDSITGITYDALERPGTANLLDLLSACTGEQPTILAERFQDHGELKRAVTEAVVEEMKGPREAFERLRGERGYLEEVARDGAEKASSIAGRTMGEVRRLVGLA
ncbi:tryptophanyl-tRNA synthetase [Peniophora sp. CONT]|nr:tryptophanyl-tRNA synthetase [Peniophora sp. CONT]